MQVGLSYGLDTASYWKPLAAAQSQVACNDYLAHAGAQIEVLLGEQQEPIRPEAGASQAAQGLERTGPRCTEQHGHPWALDVAPVQGAGCPQLEVHQEWYNPCSYHY